MFTFIIISLSFIIAAIGLAFAYIQHKRQQQQANLIGDLQSQLSALTAGAVHTDERVIAFERTIANLKEQQSHLSASITPQHNYDHAIRLARKGIASSQLVDSCNLSDEEAHLIERMHGEKEHVHALN